MEKKTIENMDYNYDIYTQIENLKIIREWINDTDILLRRIEKMDINNIQKQIEEAYQRGLEDGRNETWETARKITTDKKFPLTVLKDIFGKLNVCEIFETITPTEAIEKLKAYEEKQKADGEIKRGDEVEHEVTGLKYIVTRIDESSTTLLYSDGSTAVVTTGKEHLKKTGRHIDIEKIWKEMKE